MPLSKIKVVEMGQYVVGPFAATVLADWGAEVIKIESPEGGDPARSLMSSGVLEKMDINPLLALGNHNKRSICLDMKKDQGRKIAHELVRRADVFISNMRARVLEKLNMDWETLTTINPRLIYALNTAYGLKGAERDRPALDETAFWARGGFMSILGEPGDVPASLRGAQGDLPTAMFLVCGILLALMHREQTGLGQRVDTSLLGSGVWVNGLDIQSSLIGGKDVSRDSRKTKGNPLYNIYQTREHRWLQFAMPQTDRYWKGFCRSIEREDLEDDPRFNSHEKRCRNNVALISILDEAIAAKTIEELAPGFDEEDLVWAHGSTIAELCNDPQVIENEYIRNVDYNTAHHPQKMVACPVKLSNVSTRDLQAAPELGQHTEDVLLELGYSWKNITELKEHQVIP